MKRKVCVIYGGRSGEHEVSVTSAESVINALDRNRYEVRAMAITRSGKWIDDILPQDYRGKYLGGRNYAQLSEETGEIIVGKQEVGGIDEVSSDYPNIVGPRSDPGDTPVVLPILHGPFGEDGTIQGMLEMMDLPYIGAGVLGSALAMDKAAAKYMCLAYGIPVVEFIDFIRPQWVSDQKSVVEAIEKNLEYPCFVKPANLGSSVGITKVHGGDELCDAIEQAFRYDNKILVEQALDCREIECSVLGNDEPDVSVAGEIIPCNEYYDYEAKYLDNRSELIIPARIDIEIMGEVQGIAVNAFKALNCSGMARADFFIEKESNEVFFNELNTIPGFTSISMYAKLWEASGLPYSELLDTLIELAVERYEEKQRIHGNILQPKKS